MNPIPPPRRHKHISTQAHAAYGQASLPILRHSSIRAARVRTVRAVIANAPMMFFAVSLVFTTTACNRPKHRFKPAWLAGRADVARYVQLALEAPDADLRRAAVCQLRRTRHAGDPPVIDTFALIARTDTSESVRCAAVTGLGEQGGDVAISSMLAVLSVQDAGVGVRPAGERLRWEAMKALRDAARDQQIEPRFADSVREIAVARLAGDPARDVRITAAELLGHDPTKQSARALLDALRQADFGVVYEADRSLMRLTGQKHDHDPVRWMQWLESAEHPFAQRGALDADLDGSHGSTWPFRR